MELHALQKKLKNDLLKHPNLEIDCSDIWGLPINRVELSYMTVKRTKMDVLMKMIMITMQKINISSSEQVSNFLNVEPLFVEGIMNKMLLTSMITKNETSFSLTEKGTERLQAGVYESPPEQGKKKFIYSPCHQELLNDERDFESVEKIKTYRFREQTLQPATFLNQDQLTEALQTAEVESSEESMQIIITHIDPPKLIEGKLVPCIEFSILNKQDQSRFTRVWNTLLSQWDESLEKQIEEYGRLDHNNQ